VFDESLKGRKAQEDETGGQGGSCQSNDRDVAGKIGQGFR
jgi:hypothetical protein